MRKGETPPHPCLLQPLYRGQQDLVGYRDRFEGTRRELLQSTLLETGDARGGMLHPAGHLNPRSKARDICLPAAWNPGARGKITGQGMQPRQFPRLLSQGGTPGLAGAIGMSPDKILITVASKVPPVTAVAGPAQEVQIIGIAGILVTSMRSRVT